MDQIKEVIVSSALIDELYKRGSVSTPSHVQCMGWFLILKSDCGKSALAAYQGDTLVLVSGKALKTQNISPKDAGQTCLMWALDEYDMVIAVGGAGTGKTTVALAWAVNQMMKHNKRIILCKPTHFVGGKSNAIAAIPGTHREKLEGYIDSYLGALRKIMGDNYLEYLRTLEESGKVIFQPLELLRGLDFENSVVIIDEAQNTTPHDLMSAISRVGQASTCIVLGDPRQVDIDLHPSETGLAVLLNSEAMKYTEIACAVRLNGQYRGPLATLASEVLEEFYAEEEYYENSEEV